MHVRSLLIRAKSKTGVLHVSLLVFGRTEMKGTESSIYHLLRNINLRGFVCHNDVNVDRKFIC